MRRPRQAVRPAFELVSPYFLSFGSHSAPLPSKPWQSLTIVHLASIPVVSERAVRRPVGRVTDSGPFGLLNSLTTSRRAPERHGAQDEAGPPALVFTVAIETDLLGFGERAA